MDYNYEELQTHLKAIMDFMKEQYPNNFEMILSPKYAVIRSNMTALTFVNEPPKDEVPKVESEVVESSDGE